MEFSVGTDLLGRERYYAGGTFRGIIVVGGGEGSFPWRKEAGFPALFDNDQKLHKKRFF